MTGKKTESISRLTKKSDDNSSSSDPAEWRPYEPKEFNKDFGKISKIFVSDPSRKESLTKSSSDDSSND